jgi:hypothetical protein
MTTSLRLVFCCPSLVLVVAFMYRRAILCTFQIAVEFFYVPVGGEGGGRGGGGREEIYTGREQLEFQLYPYRRDSLTPYPTPPPHPCPCPVHKKDWVHKSQVQEVQGTGGEADQTFHIPDQLASDVRAAFLSPMHGCYSDFRQGVAHWQ